MVKHYECSKCHNKMIVVAQKEPNVICFNCFGTITEDDFKGFKVDLENLFFTASSIQKMGTRYIIEIPKKSSAEIKIKHMGERVRKGPWTVKMMIG